MRKPRTRKLLTGCLTLAVLLALWAGFAPPSLGGSTSYVVTDGISMEPLFHTGDLALVRSESNYRVGQVVAYHSNVFHTVVLHRIIAVDGDRYVFKGDNNNFVDFEHPARSQLIGALWIHLPGWGARLQSLRSPGLIAALVTVGVLLMLGTAFVKRDRRRRRRRREEAGGSPHTPLSARAWVGHDGALTVLAGGLLALAPFVVLALLAFTRPSSALSPVQVPYTQNGTLSYSAPAAPGPAYPSGEARTGEPLFTHALRDIDFEYHYSLSSHTSRALAGTASLTAEVSSTSGWQSTLPLGGVTRFNGDSVLVRGTLDLDALDGLLREVQSQTAVSGTYTLNLQPHVKIGGSLGNVPLHTTFAPVIPFSLSSTEIRAVLPQSTGAKAPDPYTRSEGGSAAGRSYQPTYLSLRLARLSVSDARIIAIAAILLIAGAIGVALLLILARPGGSESSLIASRLGSMIVPVARVWQQPGVPVIDVEDIDALARIAEHYDRSILQEHTAEGEAFWVSDESGQFRYMADRPVAVAPASPEQWEPATVVQEQPAPVAEQPAPEEAGYVSPDVDRRSGSLALRWAEPSTLTHPLGPAH